MNVIQTIPWLVPEAGGPARSVTKLCSYLTEQALSVHLLTLDFGAKFDAPIMPINAVNTVFVPCGWSIGLTSIWAPQYEVKLRELCADATLTVIHDQGLWLATNHTVAAFAAKKQIPLILSARGMLEPWALQNSFLKKQLAWRLYQRRDLQKAAVLHATSADEAQNLRQLGLRQPIAMIPNGVDLPPFHQPMPETKAKRKRTVLFLSRIHPKKGLFNLIKAWQIVQPIGWQVIIAGPDEHGHQRAVQTEICAAGLQDSVRLIGAVADTGKWQVYQQADLFVLPTFSENFGIVVAEALATGLPVITTKGAPWQDLETYHCGWWIEIGVEPLVQALRAALDLTDEARTIMGQNGRRLVEQKYGWPDVAGKMAAVYRWMLGQGDKPIDVWD